MGARRLAQACKERLQLEDEGRVGLGVFEIDRQLSVAGRHRQRRAVCSLHRLRLLRRPRRRRLLRHLPSISSLGCSASRTEHAVAGVQRAPPNHHLASGRCLSQHRRRRRIERIAVHKHRRATRVQPCHHRAEFRPACEVARAFVGTARVDRDRRGTRLHQPYAAAECLVWPVAVQPHLARECNLGWQRAAQRTHHGLGTLGVGKERAP